MMTPPPATRKEIAANETRSKPLVVEDDVIVISSDSDDEPPAPATKPSATKSGPPGTNPPAVPNRHRRQVEHPLEKKRKKSVHDVDAEENECQDSELQRLRKKTAEMQADNERIKSKLEAYEMQLQDLQRELKGKKDKLENLRHYFECDICMETLWRPWALSHCGHTFCKKCLISLFNANKFECPTCRVRVEHRPVEIFAFKNTIRGVAGAAPPEVDLPCEGGRVWDPLWPPAPPAHPH